MIRQAALIAALTAILHFSIQDSVAQQQEAGSTQDKSKNPVVKKQDPQKKDVKIDPKTGREIDPKTGKPRKLTIADVMKEAHGKKTLAKKVALGKAKPEEVKRLHELYVEMSKMKPPKGDVKSWNSKNDALVKAAKLAVDGKVNAKKQLQKATDCMGCHKVHKPKKIVPENWQQKPKQRKKKTDQQKTDQLNEGRDPKSDKSPKK